MCLNFIKFKHTGDRDGVQEMIIYIYIYIYILISTRSGFQNKGCINNFPTPCIYCLPFKVSTILQGAAIFILDQYITTFTHIHTQALTYMVVCMHCLKHKYTHAHTHTYVLKCTLAYSPAHTYIYVYMCAYECIWKLPPPNKKKMHELFTRHALAVQLQP